MLVHTKSRQPIMACCCVRPMERHPQPPTISCLRSCQCRNYTSLVFTSDSYLEFVFLFAHLYVLSAHSKRHFTSRRWPRPADFLVHGVFMVAQARLIYLSVRIADSSFLILSLWFSLLRTASCLHVFTLFFFLCPGSLCTSCLCVLSS